MISKYIKKIACGLLTAILAVSPVFADTSLSSGAPEGNDSGITDYYDETRIGKLTIDYSDDDAIASAIKGAKFCLYRVADYKNLVGNGHVGSNYVSSIEGISVDGNTKAEDITDAVLTYYKDKDVISGVTDENGKLEFNLETGVYLAVETVPVVGHLPSDPFLIAMPGAFTSDGYVTGWNYNLTAYPKPNLVSVGTTLTENGIHESGVKDNATFTDTVKLTGLIPGDTYYLYGNLIDKDTKTTVGKQAEKKFVAKSPEVIETMDFSVSTTEMAGKRIVAFEDLYINQVTKDTKYGSKTDKTPSNIGTEEHLHQLHVGTHSDLSDEDQTVHIVEIKTTLTGDNGGKTSEADSKTMNDTVVCKGLIPGNYYVLSGELYSKKTQQTTGFKKEVSFKAESEEQEVKVPFDGLDLSKYAGDSLVAYEKLYSDTVKNGSHDKTTKDTSSDDSKTVTKTDGKDATTSSLVLITSHEDIKDAAQTVAVNKKKEDKNKEKGNDSGGSSSNGGGSSSNGGGKDGASSISNVKTGDNMHVDLYAMLFALAGIAIGFIVRRKYKTV